MSEDGKIDAVLVEQRLEGRLAGSTDVGAAAGGVPGTVSADDEPGCDGAVDGCEVRGEEIELLV